MSSMKIFIEYNYYNAQLLLSTRMWQENDNIP